MCCADHLDCAPSPTLEYALAPFGERETSCARFASAALIDFAELDHDTSVVTLEHREKSE